MVAVVWSVLVAWRPTTTWHLAPLILAAAWPWAVDQDASSGDSSARRRIMLAGVAGLGAHGGPVFDRSPGRTYMDRVGNPCGRSAPPVGGGAAIATVMGLLRTVRRTRRASARLGTSHVATSDDIVTVEGNAYFPLTSVPEGVLQPSNTTTVCPWKGIASYFDVHVDGQVVPDGAFTYRHPSPLARRIKGRVAFWKGIEVDTTRPN